MVEGFTYIPHRFALGFAEAPRGDDIHWSMTGEQPEAVPLRCRAANLPRTGRPCATCCVANTFPMRR
ncbi:formate hydrogenlyase subunit E [Escherichia coli]|uniref:Formate hydrogenlyase subunit E n=1 Tax=Escherichia coli TaxID=562 RepID=A0A2X3LTH0_ECOLX|nr:formate hydrogenlyase subunit E [Escherichia coli]